MFNNKSIYALNKKDPDAIVYTDAGGNMLRLTREDFASEDDFLRWKRWSDGDYHASEKEGHTYADHTLSLETLSDEAAAVQSPEAVLFNRLAKTEHIQNRTALMEQVRAVLTEIQYRRLWMYCVEGLSEKEIAAQEGVGQQRISKSIIMGKKSLEKHFSKQGVK